MEDRRESLAVLSGVGPKLQPEGGIASYVEESAGALERQARVQLCLSLGERANGQPGGRAGGKSHEVVEHLLHLGDADGASAKDDSVRATAKIVEKVVHCRRRGEGGL